MTDASLTEESTSEMERIRDTVAKGRIMDATSTVELAPDAVLLVHSIFTVRSYSTEVGVRVALKMEEPADDVVPD